MSKERARAQVREAGLRVVIYLRTRPGRRELRSTLLAAEGDGDPEARRAGMEVVLAAMLDIGMVVADGDWVVLSDRIPRESPGPSRN